MTHVDQRDTTSYLTNVLLLSLQYFLFISGVIPSCDSLLSNLYTSARRARVAGATTFFGLVSTPSHHIQQHLSR